VRAVDRCGWLALKQPAIGQQAVIGVHMQLIAAAGNAVVFDIWIAHGYSFNDVNQRLTTC